MTPSEFRTLRISLGLSQAALGMIMGMRGDDICRIETSRKPTLVQASFLKYIADTVKTKPNEENTMERIALKDGGWFNAYSSVKFDEDTYWDGNNNISVATGSQLNHEVLYYTKGGNWVLNTWSQYQGSRETYRKISESAAVNWLIKNDCTGEIGSLPPRVIEAVSAAVMEQEV